LLGQPDRGRSRRTHGHARGRGAPAHGPWQAQDATMRSRFFRIALGSALTVAAALAGLQQLGAQSIPGHDSNAPVNYAADRIELQDKQKRVVLSGNVDISQGGLRMRAARTTVAYTDTDALRIQRMDATGGVVVIRDGETARGDVAIYDFNREIITM